MQRFSALATLTSLTISGAAISAELTDGPVRAQAMPQGSFLTFKVENWPAGTNGVVVLIEGPKEYSALIEFGKNVPGFDLAKYGELADGVYSYEIRGGTGEKVKKPEELNNGRDGRELAFDLASFVLSGQLVVKGGAIVNFKQIPEVGSEKPTIGETKPDTDSGEPPKSGDGEPGKGDGSGADADRG